VAFGVCEGRYKVHPKEKVVSSGEYISLLIYTVVCFLIFN